VSPLELEQSNPIFRKYKKVLEYFVRINIISENKTDLFFNTKKSQKLLNNFVKNSVDDVKFCGIELKFLGYSNSQIKGKSWWMFIKNHKIKFDLPDSPSNEESKGKSS
jgi:hypothetical protein